MSKNFDDLFLGTDETDEKPTKVKEKPKEPTLEANEVKVPEVEPMTGPTTTIPGQLPSTAKEEELPETTTSNFDETDLAIIRLVAQKYKAQGTNMVRHDVKNPFVAEFSRLAYLIQQKESFKELHAKEILKSTKYSGQYNL
jgi:hypothetical protein